MSPRGPAAARRGRSAPYSAAQMRTITAALDLFGKRGVSGTSLQMIADASGVTKASVYYQFKTKEAIVVAAIEVEFRRLEAALDAAEATDGDPRAREALLAQVISQAIERHRLVTTLQHDPVIVRLLAEHQPFQEKLERLFRALLGTDPDTRTRIRVAMVASAIGSVVTNPLVAGLDDSTLRTGLLDLSLEFLNLAKN
jgi:AcrR family transcriptional regulator